jgi:MFS family permease
MFLTGALGVQLTSDLKFGAFGLGAAVATHRAASALTALPAGRFADRLGASYSLRLAAAVAGLASLAIAATARNWWSLALCLAIAGASMALAEPAANRLLMNTVSERRLGMAFGIKQSAAPAATMIAGMCVPWVAVHLGWRSTFVLSGLLAATVVAFVARTPRRRLPAGSSGHARLKLHNAPLIVLLAAALGLSSASSSTISSFYVVSAASAGAEVRVAGTILAVASAATIVTRLVAGVFADRIPENHLYLSAGGQLLGCLGFPLLATDRPPLMAVGAVIGMAGTWGFHGLSWFAMVRAYASTPGAITGAIAPGALLGGVVGPLIFGTVASGLGFRAGWISGAAMALLAAALMIVANRRLRGSTF